MMIRDRKRVVTVLVLCTLFLITAILLGVGFPLGSARAALTDTPVDWNNFTFVD